jgi:RNA polymerase sigma-70 factor (ECF subfamily)
LAVLLLAVLATYLRYLTGFRRSDPGMALFVIPMARFAHHGGVAVTQRVESSYGEPESAALPEGPAVLDAAAQVRLSQIAAAHFNWLWRLLRRLGVHPSDVEDAAQQVFLVVSRRLSTIERGSEQSFLFGVAIRVAIEHRRVRRDVPTPDVELDARKSSPAMEELVDQHRARQVLAEILDGLPLELRTVFVLFELEQMTKTEISNIVGIPEGTVVSRLRRAREIFENRVKQRKAASGFRRRMS